MQQSKRIVILFLICITSTQIVFAQHIDIDKKTLSFLASEEKIATVFSFENVLFYEDNKTEEEFLQNQNNKITEWKDEEAAKDWVKTYYSSKENDWPDSFLNTLNEKLTEYNNSPTFVNKDSDTKYTMKVHTVWMYFGYNVIVGKKPAKVTMDISFYETDNPENIIANTKISRAMGLNNENYDLSNWPSFRRVGKAYVKGAYKLAQAFKRILD